MTAKPEYFERNFFIDLLKIGGTLTTEKVSKEDFIKFSERHSELRIEREKNGKLTIMAPVLGGSGYRENRIAFYITSWSDAMEKGEVFGSNTGFDLPDGATKSPDTAWLSDATLATLRPEQIEKEFIPTIPDFIVEIRSQSDSLKTLQKKMKETWIANGVKLGWLIDPYKEKVHIYRSNGEIEFIEGFENQLSGENILPGLVVRLEKFRVRKS